MASGPARGRCRCSRSPAGRVCASTRTATRERWCRPTTTRLLAKLIAHGADREAAIDLLDDALQDVDVEGLETNRALLQSVLGHPDFRAGRSRPTGWPAVIA